MRPTAWLLLAALIGLALGYALGREAGPHAKPATRHASLARGEPAPSWPVVWPDGGPPIGPDLEALLEDPGASRDVERLIELLEIGSAGRGLGRSGLDGWQPGRPLARSRHRGPLRRWPPFPTPFATWFLQGSPHALVAGWWVPRRDAAWAPLDPGAR